MVEEAYFAAGCFWGVERQFGAVSGVIDTKVGYMNGHVANPNYTMVCGGDTGHAEAVRVVFDPARVSYADLVAVFWRIHDPTQKNRQGFDVGRQYRSAIFVTSDRQRDDAVALMATAQRKFDRPIVTEIEPAQTFYLAEDYHQRYLDKRNQR